MKRLLAAVVLVAALCQPAAGALQRWNLEDVLFDDGGSATGWFTVDGSQAGPDWHLVTTPGAALDGTVYTPADSQVFLYAYPAGRLTLVFDQDYSLALRLGFDAADGLPALPGPVPLVQTWDGYGNLECTDCAVARFIVSGEVTAAPEPAPAALAAVALAVLALRLRGWRRPAGVPLP